MNFLSLIGRKPDAVAKILGSPDYPDLNGIVSFYQTNMGVVIVSQISGLPKGVAPCNQPIFAFHIHSGSACTGNESDVFFDAMTHYNPDECQHPYHAGDMPPLFGADRFAFSAFLTNRLLLDEIIGKTVIIHDSPDDFSSQPAGNSGKKIACGVIYRY